MTAEKYIVVVLPPGWAKQVTRDLAAIKRALRIIEQNEEQHMSEITDKLDGLEAGETAIETSLTALDADEERELADLTELKNAGTVTPDDLARLDALAARQAATQAAIDADTAAIDTADPAPAEGAPVGDVPADTPAGAAPAE